MNFLQPWVLWGLPLIAIPVVIHLMHKRRHRVVEWGAMMFLLDGAKLSRGRQRLREILLLAMRTLAVLGLLLGVGRPIAGGWVGRVGGEAVDTIIVVVDRSASMAEHVQGAPESKLAAGMRALRGALEVTSAPELIMIDAVRPGRAQRLTSAADLSVLGMDEATAAASDMPAAFETAVTYLQESAAGRSEIWVVSDGQSSDWAPADGRWQGLAAAMNDLPAGVRVRLTLDQTERAENLGVRVTRVRRVVEDGAAELVLDAVVNRASAAEGSGDTAMRVDLAIEVGGARSVAELEMVGSEARLQGHRIPVDSVGEEGFGVVELVADGRPSDDRFWFVFGDDPTLETLVVSEDEDVERIARIASELPFDPTLRLTSRGIEPAEFDGATGLAGTSLVIWQAALPEEGGEVAALLEGFIGTGGVILFLPPGAAEGAGPRYRGVRWGTWNEVVVGDEGASPETWRADDDLLATGVDGTPIPVGEVELYRWCEIDVDGSAYTHQTLASLPGAERLLVRAGTPSGGAYFLGTWPTPGAGNLAAQGIVLVAMIQRAVDLASLSQRSASWRDAGAVELGADWRPAEEAGRGALSALDVSSGVVSNGDQWLALNRPDSEDEAALHPIASLTELFGDVDVVTAEVARSAAKDNGGLLEEIWRVFMVLALIGVLAEALLCVTEGDAPPVNDDPEEAAA
ncbi:MAG: BatA domain-containing protein [Planctomycetota bacterium]|nr:BatA domain-containing protein [Planctomycetota bacterium]